jgi:hypothetical protein
MRGKKLRGNGLWESMRMMLPEHKHALRMHRQTTHKAEQCADRLRVAQRTQALVTVHALAVYTGTIKACDETRVHLRVDDEDITIAIAHITDVYEQ